MFSAITKQSRNSFDTIMKTSVYGGLTVTTSPSFLHHCSNGRPSFMSPTKCKVAMKWTCIKSEMLRFAGTPTSHSGKNDLIHEEIDEHADYSTTDSNADVMREDLQSTKSGSNEKARKISAGEGYGAAAPEEQELYENMKSNSNNNKSSGTSKEFNSDPTKVKSTNATKRATAHIKPDNS